MPTRSPVPYSGSRGLQQYDPLLDFHREVDRLFDDVFGGGFRLATGSSAAGGAVMPRIDVHEDATEICITADLPGVRPADVDVRVDGDVLTISGETQKDAERNEAGYHVMERSRGSFRRSLRLPFAPDMDQVRAESHHGVLTVHVPRQAQEAQRARRIEVRDTSQPLPSNEQSTGTGSGSGSGSGSASAASGATPSKTGESTRH
ncbi:MAG TPA: Hsp20/alpha crystallin family protein [Aquabacterium sp.]|nr:Hsp20/alpha crystallin family protein [Aquabacterium sp.]